MHKGRIEFYDPTTQSRKPAKAISIVDDDGLEYAPNDIKSIDDKVNTLSGTSGTKEKANKEELDNYKTTNTNELNKKLNKSGDTATGIVKAYPNTSHTVAQVRNIILSPNDADVNAMNDGEIWIKYK